MQRRARQALMWGRAVCVALTAVVVSAAILFVSLIVRLVMT